MEDVTAHKASLVTEHLCSGSQLYFSDADMLLTLTTLEFVRVEKGTL